MRSGAGSALGLLIGLAIGLPVCSCAPWLDSRSFAYFERPNPRDPWSAKIELWQSRERALPDLDALRAPASVSGSRGGAPAGGASSDEDLRAKYFAFRAERKREMAFDVAHWIQKQARAHYLPDGVVDHWATLEETLAGNGDDCDGLELLVFYFLRDLGFSENEVYRAIVYRPLDGQHHMVTLWFEDPEDPWVIDPTGAMVTGMPRMSDVAGWVPLKVFSETQEFSAGPKVQPVSAGARAPSSEDGGTRSAAR